MRRHETSLDDPLERLVRWRERSWIADALRLATVIMAVATVILSTAWLAVLTPGTAEYAQVWTVALGAIGTSLLLGLTIARIRLPSLRGYAKRVETELGLEERLTTLFDVRGRTVGSPEQAVLADRLEDDVAQRMRGVRPVRQIPLPARTWMLLGGMAALAATMPLVRGRAPEPEPPPGGGPSASVQASLDEARLGDLQRVADSIRRRAAATADPRDRAYLDAVADALDRAVTAARTGTTDAAALRASVRDLARHLDAAMGEGRLGDALRTAVQEPTEADAVGATTEPAGASSSPSTPTGSTPAPAASTASSSQGRAAERGDVSERRDVTYAEVETETVRGSYERVDAEEARRIAEQRRERQALRREAQAGGALVGAASDSEAGASRRAGGGTQELGGDGDAPDPALGSSDASMNVATSEPSSRSVTIRIPPQTELSDVAVVRIDDAEWRASPESPSRPITVTGDHAAAVRRFFLAEEGTEEP